MLNKKLSILIKIVIFVALTVLVLSDLPDQFLPAGYVNLISDIRNVGYSPDQKFLVALKKQNIGSFFLYDGIRLKMISQIAILDEESQVSPTAFAFSPDSSMLVIGTQQGRLYGFTFTDGKLDQPYKYKHVVDQTRQLIVASISISKQNHIFVAAQKQIIVLSVTQNERSAGFQKLYSFTAPHKITSFAWSPNQVDIVLYGCIGASDAGFFGTFDFTSNKSTEFNSKNTMSVRFFPDGKTIAQGLQEDDITLYSYPDHQLIGKLEDTKNTTQIMISQSGQFLGAVAQSNGRIKGWKFNFVQKQLNLINNKDNELQITNKPALDQPGQNLAFSNNGNQLLIIPSGGTGTMPKFTLCAKGTYLQQNACVSCPSNCPQCFDASICFSCDEKHYLQNDLCITCSTTLPGCTTCSDKSTCLTCNTNLNWKPDADQVSGKCICQDNFVDENSNIQLEEGFFVQVKNKFLGNNSDSGKCIKKQKEQEVGYVWMLVIGLFCVLFLGPLIRCIAKRKNGSKPSKAENQIKERLVEPEVEIQNPIIKENKRQQPLQNIIQNNPQQINYQIRQQLSDIQIARMSSRSWGNNRNSIQQQENPQFRHSIQLSIPSNKQIYNPAFITPIFQSQQQQSFYSPLQHNVIMKVQNNENLKQQMA